MFIFEQGIHIMIFFAVKGARELKPQLKRDRRQLIRDYVFMCILAAIAATFMSETEAASMVSVYGWVVVLRFLERVVTLKTMPPEEEEKPTDVSWDKKMETQRMIIENGRARPDDD